MSRLLSNRTWFALGTTVSLVTTAAAPPLVAAYVQSAESPAPSQLTRLAAENLDWVVRAFAGDTFAGATIDRDRRAVTLYVGPKFDQASGTVLVGSIIAEMEKRLDRLAVDGTGAYVPRNHTDVYSLDIVSAPRSADQLQDQMELVMGYQGDRSEIATAPSAEWTAKVASRVFSVSFDPKEGKLLAEVLALTKADEELATRAFGSEVALLKTDAETTLTSQGVDLPPHFASAGIKRSLGSGVYALCTSGFTTMDKSGIRKMLTAGHCGSGNFTSVGGSSYFGTTEVIRNPLTDPDHFDFQYFGAGTYDPRNYRSNGATISAFNQTWQNSTLSSNVNGTGLPGTSITVHGAHYGSFAYSITSETTACYNFNFSGTISPICGLARATRLGACPNGVGDSGAAVTATAYGGANSAVGIQNGISAVTLPSGQSQCQLYYTPIAQVAGTLGVSVVIV